MNFISRLMPREGRFFSLFDGHAKLIVEGAIALADVLRHYDNKKRSRDAHQAHRRRRTRAPIASRTKPCSCCTPRSSRPFDRDDIHRLISRMDDVLDLIQDTAESLVLYDIQKVTPEATQLAELLLRLLRTRAVGGGLLMASMADAPAILKICQEIDRLESDADR